MIVSVFYLATKRKLTERISIWNLRRPVCNTPMVAASADSLCRHGEPNRDAQAIDWEGRPDSVAFHPPYVLLVSTPFIEIRHIDTGKLLQIYTGTDIHLTWE